jgi:hypothetical protein
MAIAIKCDMLENALNLSGRGCQPGWRMQCCMCGGYYLVRRRSSRTCSPRCRQRLKRYGQQVSPAGPKYVGVVPAKNRGMGDKPFHLL